MIEIDVILWKRNINPIIACDKPARRQTEPTSPFQSWTCRVSVTFFDEETYVLKKWSTDGYSESILPKSMHNQYESYPEGQPHQKMRSENSPCSNNKGPWWSHLLRTTRMFSHPQKFFGFFLPKCSQKSHEEKLRPSSFSFSYKCSPLKPKDGS